MVRGTPEQLLNAVKNRIAELQDGEVESSFVYPDDLEDLENGEYESHVTEPINASLDYDSYSVADWLSDHDQAYEDCKKYFDTDDLESVDRSDLVDWISEHDSLYEDFVLRFADDPTREVLDFFKNNLGWDIKEERVQNYADAVAEYMDMSRDAYAREGQKSPYTLQDWYKDTKENYPEELEEFEACVNSKGKKIESSEEIDDDEYLNSLMSCVDSKLSENQIFNNHDWDVKDHSLKLVSSSEHGVNEFDIPYEDLSFEKEEVDQDADYIFGEVVRLIEE